ncbi:hypothetical protein QC761_0045190 [Podospora bellae-mahoneyi]|uniref:Uncharacterized protein n=1 Tax=Podospora bellae-mahoneyi TaxID=2093777 RepID=A0ABR0FRT6_9PEZI|nr:hypothetical protein QC761_0045190 [Podospora bellae-mahoneyi]
MSLTSRWPIIDKIDRRCQYDCWCAEDDLSAQCCASIDGTFDENPTPTCVKMNLTGATTFATCCGSKNGYGCSQKTRCPRPDGGDSYVDRGPQSSCTVMKYDISMVETAVVGNGGESVPVRVLV